MRRLLAILVVGYMIPSQSYAWFIGSQAGGNWLQAPVSEQATVAQELEQEPADDLAVELDDGEEAEEAQELAE